MQELNDQEVNALFKAMDDKVFKAGVKTKLRSISVKKGSDKLKQNVKGKVTHDLKEDPTVHTLLCKKDKGIKVKGTKL